MTSRRSPNANWSLQGIHKDFTAYQCGHMCALSSLVYVEDEHLPPHWEWLISFSDMGTRRLSNHDIKKCLKDFDALDFEEDNHERGVVRKFWLAVDHQYRKPCPCKDETVIVEGDYQYSVKKLEKGGVYAGHDQNDRG